MAEKAFQSLSKPASKVVQLAYMPYVFDVELAAKHKGKDDGLVRVYIYVLSAREKMR